MTDKDLETVQDSEIVESSQPVEEPAVEVDDDVQKPVFNKIQMKDVVEREKRKAFERGKREALMELQNQQSAQQEPQAQMQPQSQVGLGGMNNLSPADVQRMMAEQVPQILQNQVQQFKQEQVVNAFVSKMQAAEQKYPGLEKELNQLNFEDDRMAPFIQLVNSMDNTGEIMKELLDNPTKMETVLNMAKNQPYVAQKTLNSLSQSILQNQQALAQEAQARDPMSQLKPSTSAGKDSGDLSVQDLRKMFSR